VVTTISAAKEKYLFMNPTLLQLTRWTRFVGGPIVRIGQEGPKEVKKNKDC
jgi:hypothetical protein